MNKSIRSDKSFLVDICYGLSRLGLLHTAPVQQLYVRAYFLYKRWHEDPFRKFFSARLSPVTGGHILDVGAHIGYTASVFAGFVSEGFQVHAFEPDPASFHLLEKTIRRRHLQDRVRAVQSAAGKESGRGYLGVHPYHLGDHALIPGDVDGDRMEGMEPVSVEVIRLDDYGREVIGDEPVAFVKIDVQGGEQDVLEGMQELIERNPGLSIGLEYEPRRILRAGKTPEGLLKLCSRLGFEIRMILRSGELLPLNEKKLLEMKEGDYCDLFLRQER